MKRLKIANDRKEPACVVSVILIIRNPADDGLTVLAQTTSNRPHQYNLRIIVLVFH